MRQPHARSGAGCRPVPRSFPENHGRCPAPARRRRSPRASAVTWWRPAAGHAGALGTGRAVVVKRLDIGRRTGKDQSVYHLGMSALSSSSPGWVSRWAGRTPPWLPHVHTSRQWSGWHAAAHGGASGDADHGHTWHSVLRQWVLRGLGWQGWGRTAGATGTSDTRGHRCGA